MLNNSQHQRFSESYKYVLESTHSLLSIKVNYQIPLLIFFLLYAYN